MINISYALGDIIMGMLLVGENAENRLFVGLLLPVAGIAYLISIFFIRKVKMN